MFPWLTAAVTSCAHPCLECVQKQFKRNWEQFQNIPLSCTQLPLPLLRMKLTVGAIIKPFIKSYRSVSFLSFVLDQYSGVYCVCNVKCLCGIKHPYLCANHLNISYFKCVHEQLCDMLWFTSHASYHRWT